MLKILEIFLQQYHPNSQSVLKILYQYFFVIMSFLMFFIRFSRRTYIVGAVLWIRIRNNPNVLAGSESESEQKVRIRIRIRIRIQTLL
jgi:hypothetical protein